MPEYNLAHINGCSTSQECPYMKITNQVQKKSEKHHATGKNYQKRGFLDPWNKYRMLHIFSH